MRTDMRINDIKKLTYNDARNIAIEEMKIKDHDCIFANLGDTFGYSVLVFKNNHHIYYANDYQLHHNHIVKEKGIEALRDLYIETLNHKLYTNEELLEEIKNYSEYNAKNYFLRNYWIMRYDYLSCFYVSNEKNDKEFEEKKKSFPFFNLVSFCYVTDKSIINEQVKYMNHLEDEYERLQNNNDTFRGMISYELANHEACITCDYKPTLDYLGIDYNELSEEKQKIVKEELQKQIDRYDSCY